MAKLARRKVAYRRAAPKKARVSLPRLRRTILSLNETKFQDTTQAAYTVPVAWTNTNIYPLIQQGTSANQRIGNKIFLKQITFRIFMNPLVTMPASGAYCRVIVVHNKETVGVLTAALTVFTADSIFSQRNTALNKRVSVIKDFNHTMVFSGSATQMGPKRFLEFSIFPRKVIDYNGNTGTAADLFKDSYTLMTVCEDPAGCQMTWTAKCLFTDV